MRCSASSTRVRPRGPRDPPPGRGPPPRTLPDRAAPAPTRACTLVAAEGLDLDAEPLELAACCASACRCAGESSSSSGTSRRCDLEPSRRQPLHHPLEQHPLVRDVLVDDRDPFVIDRDDERVAELARAESSDGSPLDRGIPDPDDRESACPGSRIAHPGSARDPMDRRRRPAPAVSGTVRPRARRGWHRGRLAGPDAAVRTANCNCGHAALAERVHQRAAHHFVHERLLAEADLRLGRMDVDVDRVGRASRGTGALPGCAP